MTKIELRKSLLKKRDSLSDISLTIINQIIDSKLLDDKKNVAIYYPLKGEVDVLALVDKYPNINFCFPKTLDEISFYKENDLTRFEKKKFNVMEPITNNFISRDEIELFIIPCVGITKDRQRIGYGKGYYDRYLAGYNGIRVGVCYKELSDLDFKCDSYDVTLDYVFKGWKMCLVL